jgi:hypothetical protein
LLLLLLLLLLLGGVGLVGKACAQLRAFEEELYGLAGIAVGYLQEASRHLLAFDAGDSHELDHILIHLGQRSGG